MQNGRGKIFKIVLICMMLMMFLSTALYSLMYIGGNNTVDENSLTGDNLTGDMENLIDVSNTGNLELTGN